ncbi:MAG: hypothetical protein QM501_04565 [Gimesia sp.]
MSSVAIDASEQHTCNPSKFTSVQINYEAVMKTCLWSVGTIVFFLAMIDFYAQTYASETQIGLLNAKEANLELNQDFRISEISPFIVGSPVIKTLPTDKYKHMCKEMIQYRWKGFFKSYSIFVYIGIGENPSIDFVH